MNELDFELQRYAALSDRAALGETLSAAERAFCERMEREHPACRFEAALLDELANLEVAPNDSTRALVDAALTRLTAGERATDREEVAQLKRTRVPRLVWASGLAAAAAALAFYLARPGHEPAQGAVAAHGHDSKPSSVAERVELVYVSGDVRIDGVSADSSSRLLHEGSELAVGQGAACIAMDPGIDVCATEGTRLRLTHTAAAWRRLDLLAGKVAVQLEPQPEGERLSIVAGTVWSTAIGTAFTVEQDAERGVLTSVLEGKVRVGSDGGREQLVAAHQHARVQKSDAVVSALSRSDEAPHWALLEPSKLWSAPVSAMLELRGLPTTAEVLLDDQPIGITPLSTLIPVGAHRLDVRVNGRVVWSRELVARAGERESITLDGIDLSAREAAAPRPEPIKPAQPERASKNVEPQAQSAASMLSAARRLLREGQLEQATLQYQALCDEHPSSVEGHIGLVSLAELQLEQLDRPADSLRSIDRYLASGAGALLPEARETRIRALRALGRRDDERAAIELFLAAHPDSLRAKRLALRLRELLPPEHSREIGNEVR